MGEHGKDHKKHYIKIWGVLCGLLVISIVGPEMDSVLPENIYIWVMLFTAFGIAGVKAWLVIKHFMHLDQEPPIMWYLLITSLVFMVLFFAGVAPDVMNHEGHRWENVAAKKAVIEGVAAGEAAGHGHGHGHGGHGDHGGHDDHEPHGEHPEPSAHGADKAHEHHDDDHHEDGDH